MSTSTGSVADDLRVVRDAGVPQKVVARPQVDLVVALRGAHTAREHDVVLHPSVGMEARLATGLGDDADDADIARHAPIHRLDADSRPGPTQLRRLAARTTTGGGVESIRNQAVGTSRARPMAASASSDGQALSFSICER